MEPLFSVVIPMNNEEHNILPLVAELEPVMEALAKPWELICIDDGSTDGSLPLLQKLLQEKRYLRILSFDKNYGQSSAFDAGFKAARGQFIITLDGDMQNDPRDIPLLVEAIQNSDMVCGIRSKRNDPWTKRAISRFANAIRSRFCGDGVSDTGCSLKIYRSSSLKKIKLFHGMHRFLPALFCIEGFRIAQIPVNHRARGSGTTKYNFFNRSFNTIADMLAVRWMFKRHLGYRIDREMP